MRFQKPLSSLNPGPKCNIRRDGEIHGVLGGRGGVTLTTLPPKALVNFRLLVTRMQSAKEFCGELSNRCQEKPPENKAQAGRNSSPSWGGSAASQMKDGSGHFSPPTAARGRKTRVRCHHVVTAGNTPRLTK